MLTRLDAEERLANIDTSAVSFGAVDADDADRLLTQLQCARDGIVPEPVKPIVATPEGLGAIGIGVTIVPAEVEPATHV